MKTYQVSQSIKIKNILKPDLENIFIVLLVLNYLLDFTSYSQFILIDLFSYYKIVDVLFFKTILKIIDFFLAILN